VAFATSTTVVGADLPSALKKDPNDGWKTKDNFNFEQEISFHKCTLADNQYFYPPNKNFASQVN